METNLRTRLGKRVAEILDSASVSIGTTNSYDVQLKSEGFIAEALAGGDIAIGEGYMDRKWWCNGDLAEILFRIFDSGLEREFRGRPWNTLGLFVSSFLARPRWVLRSRPASAAHYSLPPFLFEKMLGKDGDYTCCRWPEGVTTLAEANRVKRAELARKFHIQAGDSVLEIGCGTGGLARYLDLEHGARVTGVTNSPEHAALAEEHCKGSSVRIVLANYRDMPRETYDKIVSVGQAEHVPLQELDVYARFAYDRLRPGGMLLWHYITGSGRPNPWVNKWIFPGGVLKPMWKMEEAASRYFGPAEDWENFGWDYYLTLVAWHKNCVTHREEIDRVCGETLANLFGSTERFWRMWDFYLLSFAARFKCRKINVGQAVYVKGGVRDGVYQTSRL